MINTIGGSTFGVLCIHANSNTMREWLWGTVLNVKEAYSLPLGKLILFSVVSVVSVFLVCSLIEIVRQRIFEKKILNWIERTSLFSRIIERFELV